MKKPFLKAAWRNLLMANYLVDPDILKKYLPCKTELDEFNGVHYISLVGFLFEKVKVLGIAFPYHTNFEEVNLRFYVRYKEANVWKRGVVFMKEIVPRSIITFIANTLYKENYTTHKMKHSYTETENELHVKYLWNVGNEWNHLNCIAEKHATLADEGSAEEFITEHYWGYTNISTVCTGVYEVVHPKWKIHQVKSYDIFCNAQLLYGAAFEATLKQQPQSVFLAEGSDIKVLRGSKIYHT
jgi:uncharacterized protein